MFGIKEFDVIYISGPMTGLPGHNYHAFNSLAQKLRDMGYTVNNPAENFAGRTDLPRHVYMKRDIHLLLDSTVAIFLPGWQGSRGAVLEHDIAQELELKRIYL